MARQWDGDDPYLIVWDATRSMARFITKPPDDPSRLIGRLSDIAGLIEDKQLSPWSCFWFVVEGNEIHLEAEAPVF
jgi:hypothetical protein